MLSAVAAPPERSVVGTGVLLSATTPWFDDPPWPELRDTMTPPATAAATTAIAAKATRRRPSLLGVSARRWRMSARWETPRPTDGVARRIGAWLGSPRTPRRGASAWSRVPHFTQYLKWSRLVRLHAGHVFISSYFRERRCPPTYTWIVAQRIFAATTRVNDCALTPALQMNLGPRNGLPA